MSQFYSLVDIRTRLKFYGNLFIFRVWSPIVWVISCGIATSVVLIVATALTIPDCRELLLGCCFICVSSMMDWSLMRTDFSFFVSCFFSSYCCDLAGEKRPPCRAAGIHVHPERETLHLITCHITHTPIVLLGKGTGWNCFSPVKMTHNCAVIKKSDDTPRYIAQHPKSSLFGWIAKPAKPLI